MIAGGHACIERGLAQEGVNVRVRNAGAMRTNNPVPNPISKAALISNL